MNGEIAEYATHLLRVSGIEKVISIDDDNSTDSPPEELLGVLNVIGQDALTSVVGPLLSIESGDRELIREHVRKNWADLSKEVHAALLKELTSHAEGGVESTTLAVDLNAASKLPEIFGDKLVRLTLTAWEKQISSFVNDQMPTTLLLVDLSFTGEQRGKEEGLRVIASLLAMAPENRIYCGLLSGLFHTSTVHADWKKLAIEHKLDPRRFVLIPKDSLEMDPRTFLALIKLVVLNHPANVLRESVSKAFRDCLDESDSELDKLDVFEFERIVCLTSSKEGVWEPDTLLRVLSILHKKFVRRCLHSDRKIFDIADYLRELTSIQVGEWGGPSEMEIALRRVEWFEDATDINEQHLPLELGDVFRIESRPDRLYVLVAQPCDLMVRQDGNRHHTVENALLLEASPVDGASDGRSNNDDRNQNFYFRLDFFEAGRDWQINLRKIHYVSLDALDLCVFQKDGSCVLTDNHTAPTLMSVAWRARFPRIAAKMKKARNRYAALMKMQGMKAADAVRIAISTSIGSLWQCEITNQNRSIAFDVSRIGRIKQPRSGALLMRYANALARDAFEHDLTRRPGKEAPKPAISDHSQGTESSDAQLAKPAVLADHARPAQTPTGPEGAVTTQVKKPDTSQ